jgi:hypothetical protein
MKRFLSAPAARPDTDLTPGVQPVSGEAPDAVAIAVIILFVIAVCWFASTAGQLVALWHMEAL